VTYDGGGSVPPYPAPAPQPRRSPRWPWIVGIAVVAVAVLVAVAVVVVLRADEDSSAQGIAVTYEVTGPGSARVDYWIEPGGRALPGVVKLPWKAEVAMHGENPFVSVSATRDGASEDPLRCRITANGTTVSEDESVSRSVGCDGYVGEK
jgi:hypothetical protein